MASTPSAQSEIIRVGAHTPCPICDKPDWCGIFDDGSAALCMRVESDRPTQNGGWLHFLSDRPILSDPRPRFAAPQDLKRAGAEALNTVYHALMGELHLNPQHTQDLLHRGLSPEEVKGLRSQGYATLPDGLQRVPLVNELVERFDATLLSVPGFYLTRHHRIWLAGASGLLIPCRDVQGRIVGAQVRVDEGSNGGKYRWMSATQKQRQGGGVSSGTPLHVSQVQRVACRVPSEAKHPVTPNTPHTPITPTRVWITEGILKADIAALKLGETVIGIAGVGSWKQEEIKETLLKLAPTQVIIAFDADMTTNPAVRKQLKRLAHTVTGMGYKVSIALWDIALAKGIDELLVAGHTPTLESFRPPVAIDKLKTSPKHDGKKRVRRTPMSPSEATPLAHPPHSPTGSLAHSPTPSPPLFDLRCQLRDRIEHFALLGEGALLIKATAGLGKTVTAIDVIDTLWHNGLLRPIYAAPRHELIQENIRDGWLYIRPRKPRNEDAYQRSPEQAYQALKSLIADKASSQELVRFEELEALCHHWRTADLLGSKRWNVPKHLCALDCEIGTGLIGMAGCPYFGQYRSQRPLATVHETLFIPQFCHDIFDNPRLPPPIVGWSRTPRQVVILDEPNPSQFKETVNISTSELSRAIVQTCDDGTRRLLELLRQTAETVARRTPKRRLLGRDAMAEIVAHAGGEEAFATLLNEATAESPPKPFLVRVAIDTLLEERPQSWKVLIRDQVYYLPTSHCQKVDDRTMHVEKDYAQKEGLPILSDVELDDAHLPLNFQADLLDVLHREFERFQTGKPYNSALVITPFYSQKRLPTGGVSGSHIEPTIRLNLRREIMIPSHVPLLLLDGQGEKELLSQLLRRPVETWESPALAQTEIIQVVDGGYGKSTLWNGLKKTPTPSFFRLWEKIAKPIVESEPKDTLIVTWKCVADVLRKMQEAGEIPDTLAIEHYGNTEGVNTYEHRRNNILIGTPQCAPDDIEELAHALFPSTGGAGVGSDETPISTEQIAMWKPYRYVDCDGVGYEALVSVYQDPRMELLAKNHREDELIQAAHRVRPLIHPGKRIFLLTSLPLDALPPTHLTTVDELGEALGGLPPMDSLTKASAYQVFKDLLAEDGSVCAYSFKTALQHTFCTSTKKKVSSDGEKRPSPCDFPSDSTLWRWIREFAQAYGLERQRVVHERRGRAHGGGASWTYLYHRPGEPVDETTLRERESETLGIEPCDDITLASVLAKRAVFSDPDAPEWGDLPSHAPDAHHRDGPPGDGPMVAEQQTLFDIPSFRRWWW